MGWAGVDWCRAAVGFAWLLDSNSLRRSPRVHDDHLLEWMSGEWSLGRMTLWETVISSKSGQVTPLGALIYDRLLRTFGPGHWAFSIYLLVCHSISAGMLFFVLRERLGWLGSLVGSLFFGLLALGRWDNTLLWTANVEVALVPFLWLTSIACIERYRATGRAGWVIAALFSMAMMLAHWNASVLLLPTMILAWWGRSEANHRMSRVWLLGWLFLLIAGLLLAVSGMMRSTYGIPSDLDRLERGVFALKSAPAFFAVVLADATAWHGHGLATEGFPWKWIPLVGVISLLMMARRDGRKLAIFFGLTGLIYAAAVGWLRADLGSDVVLTSGRYYTIPLLVVSVWMAAIVDGWDWRVGKLGMSGMLAAGLVIVMGAHALHQRRLAEEAAGQFHALWKDPIEAFDRKKSLVRELVRSSPSGRPLVMADLPLDVPPVVRPFALSTLVAILEPSVRARMSIVPMRTLSLSTWSDARRLLAEIDLPEAMEWRSLIREMQEDLQAIEWLNQWGEKKGRIVRVPAIVKRYGEREYSLADWARVIAGEDLSNIDWKGTDSDRLPLREELEREADPMSRVWLEWLSR